MDRVDKPEGPGNTGETADFFFHPSRPSGFGRLVHRKSLIFPLKSVCGANRAPFHLGNPGQSHIVIPPLPKARVSAYFLRCEPRA